MTTQPQNLSREMAHAYLTGTAPRTNPLSSLICQPIMRVFVQNKPNFRKAQMNVNVFFTKDYENELCQNIQKNKAKQTHGFGGQRGQGQAGQNVIVCKIASLLV